MEKEAIAATLKGQLMIETAECEKLRETKKSLVKFEELLAKVKLDCQKVKKDNGRLEEKLKKKRKDISRLKKKLGKLFVEKETLPQSKKAKVVEHLSDSMEQAPNDGENDIAEELL